MASNSVPSCPGCGHRFYNDTPLADGRCIYCHNDPVEKCIYCGEPATCTGEFGKMCDSVNCEHAYRYQQIDEQEKIDQQAEADLQAQEDYYNEESW